MQIKDRFRGFTLIEIMVVLLIIGITIGFALLAFGDFGSKRRILMSAEQFVNYVKLVQQLATLEASTFGITVSQQGYQVSRFQGQTGWQSMSQNSMFRLQRFPKHTVISIVSEEKKASNPQIIINSSGDMSSFVLKIGTDQQSNIVQINGKQNGAVAMQLLQSP